MLSPSQDTTLKELEQALETISKDRKLLLKLLYQKGFLLSFLAQILTEDRNLRIRFHEHIAAVRNEHDPLEG